MYRYSITALLTLTILLPSIASAQLSPRERGRAQELARIQAKADGEQRMQERFNHLVMARTNCQSSGRQWDRVNETCKSR